MERQMEPSGVMPRTYQPAEVDGVLQRLFGDGEVRPLRMDEAVFDAMLAGWAAQQSARHLAAGDQA